MGKDRRGGDREDRRNWMGRERERRVRRRGKKRRGGEVSPHDHF